MVIQIVNEDQVWQELIKDKYLHSKMLTQVKPNAYDSPFSKGLLRVKNYFFIRGHFKVFNGLETRFWQDTWLGYTPLAPQYLLLNNIV